MPGLKELTDFRNRLQDLASEKDVISQWKERYEEYPYPENPPLPEVDVDNLLQDIDLPLSNKEENSDSSSSVEDLSIPSQKNDAVGSGVESENISDDTLPEQDMPSLPNLDEIDLLPPETFSMPKDQDFEDFPSLGSTQEDDKNLKENSNFTEEPASSAFALDDLPLPPSLDDMVPISDKVDDIPSFEPPPSLDVNDIQSFEPPPSLDISDVPSFEPPPPIDVDNVQEEKSHRPRKKKIDMEMWNRETSKDDAGEDDGDVAESSGFTSGDSKFDSVANMGDFLPPFDTSVEDNSNEMDFSTNLDENTGDVDLSSFDMNDMPTESDVEAGSVDDFSDENFPKASDSDGDFVLPDFDPDAFGGDNDVLSSTSDDVLPPPDVPSSEDVSSTSDVSSLDENLSKDAELENVEDAKDTVSSLQNDEVAYPDLSSFDFDNLEGGKSEDTNAESEVSTPPLDSTSTASPADDAEEIETLEELEELPSDDVVDDSTIGDFQVEDIGDALENVEGNNGGIDLEAFDESPRVEVPSIDLYTEEVDDSSPSPATLANVSDSVPNEFNSFSNIDISQGGEETVIDEHSSFNLGDNPLEENISDTMGGDGFSLPEDYTQFTQDKSASYYSKKASENDDENIPLSISDEEYEHLLERIASFPLNVRLEIEDYLANNDDTAISKMEFVHLIVSGIKLKKIVAKLSEILDKPIQIPKGFEKRSAEEYEAERKSFKWKLRHRILPFASIAAIIAIFMSCIAYLGWMFIYKPIVSETIYNKGYALLDENQYDKAMAEFERAGEYTRKKRWYFRYAQGFRDKKQFNLAETVYKWLLVDFNHDKKGGLEYVSMLRNDLHSYEKAENVLKRQVLDYHVNDETALISLGDTYLDWAREDSEKYEKARQTYSSLINMYGVKDVFLSRMMKYFIRTDKLKEVLPLKEHFVKNLGRLDMEELTELGSYLVAKRYEDDGRTPDHLGEGIDDVREILESALKREKENANANYNMGRFFLYNRELGRAEYYLSNSVNLYKNSSNLTSESLMNNVDAMRLYGEILTEQKEYLRAQEAYAEAISVYQQYSQNRLLSSNKNIGKLYQDYGDVNYFISGDLNRALMAYTMASKEMNDSPSIQYRIAYIHYQNKNYEAAMKSLLLAHSEKQKDKNLLYGLGNTLYKRGSYGVAQGYYERLMEILEAERSRKNIFFPYSRPDHNDFVNEYMRASNNLAVILNKLAMQDGNSENNGRAMALFGESSRAWDALTRNQQTMVASKAVSLAYLNTQNIMKPRANFDAEIYSDIPKTLEGERVLQNEVDR